MNTDMNTEQTAAPTEAVIDFLVNENFSFVTMTPLTPLAREWAEANVSPEVPMLGSSFPVEVRMVYDLSLDLIDQGFILGKDGKIMFEQDGELLLR